MKKMLMLFSLTLFLVSTVMAGSSDITIWTYSDEKAIAKLLNQYGERLDVPLATEEGFGLNTLTTSADAKTAYLKVFVKNIENGNFLRDEEFKITLGENYELDFRGDSIKVVERDDPIIEEESSKNEGTSNDIIEPADNTTASIDLNNTNNTDTNTTFLPNFNISVLDNYYTYGTATVLALAGVAAFVVIKKKKKKAPKINTKKKTRTSHVIERIKKKVTKEDIELKEIQEKIKEKQNMISELKKEKERKGKLKLAKKRLEEEEEELRRLLHDKKKSE